MASDTTIFNPAQQRILRMMSYINTPEALDELEWVLRKYYSAKLDEKLNRLCEEKKITEDMIEQWGKEHMRTPYKTNK